jgi:sugar phosphate isomerase/epimerase
VRSLLIMCDGEGRLGDPDEAARATAVDNHLPWLDATVLLGGHAIRVNADSEGPPHEQVRLCADGLARLSEEAASRDLDVVIENHGGLSSEGEWVAALMRAVDHPRCGTLPDFGNFGTQGNDVYNRGRPPYDPYLGVEEMMPWAKALSAKSFAFDAEGNETTIDFDRMMRIALDAGYRGWVGIEWEGDALSEQAGVLATRDLLRRLRLELATVYAA